MSVQPIPHDHDFQLEKILLAREHARVDAWQRKNRQALDALLDESFTEINVLGRFSKRDVLNILLDTVTLHAFAIEKPRLLLLGNDAVVLTYRCNETVTLGGTTQDIPAHVTALYVMRGTQWKLLHWQITPLAECGPTG